MNACSAAELGRLSGIDEKRPNPSKHLSWSACYEFWGGYRGPHWRIDRRPESLRSRRATQHFRTTLRRRAVMNLRLEGLSFRQIGRRLGFSRVAAWKLWMQIFEDLCRRGAAEVRGRARFDQAIAGEEGDPELLEALEREVMEHFGMLPPWYSVLAGESR